jgi:RimJ/RimL family protein N-acetyltransferase
MNNYLFSSDRLGFRNWKTTDVDLLYKINSDKEVMRYFPSLQTKEDTENFVILL